MGKDLTPGDPVESFNHPLPPAEDSLRVSNASPDGTVP